LIRGVKGSKAGSKGRLLGMLTGTEKKYMVPTKRRSRVEEGLLNKGPTVIPEGNNMGPPKKKQKKDSSVRKE